MAVAIIILAARRRQEAEKKKHGGRHFWMPGLYDADGNEWDDAHGFATMVHSSGESSDEDDNLPQHVRFEANVEVIDIPAGHSRAGGLKKTKSHHLGHDGKGHAQLHGRSKSAYTIDPTTKRHAAKWAEIDTFLEELGLGTYNSLFHEEGCDIHTFKYIKDSEFAALGIGQDARHRIHQALIDRQNAQRTKAEIAADKEKQRIAADKSRQQAALHQAGVEPGIGAQVIGAIGFGIVAAVDGVESVVSKTADGSRMLAHHAAEVWRTPSTEQDHPRAHEAMRTAPPVLGGAAAARNGGKGMDDAPTTINAYIPYDQQKAHSSPDSGLVKGFSDMFGFVADAGSAVVHGMVEGITSNGSHNFSTGGTMDSHHNVHSPTSAAPGPGPAVGDIAVRLTPSERRCEECNQRFFSASGLSKRCMDCRHTVSELPDVAKPRALERNSVCITCKKAFFSASGKSAQCPSCRRGGHGHAGAKQQAIADDKLTMGATHPDLTEADDWSQGGDSPRMVPIAEDDADMSNCRGCHALLVGEARQTGLCVPCRLAPAGPNRAVAAHDAGGGRPLSWDMPTHVPDDGAGGFSTPPAGLASGSYFQSPPYAQQGTPKGTPPGTHPGGNGNHPVASDANTPKTLDCAMCGLKFFSASGKSSLCVKCRQDGGSAASSTHAPMTHGTGDASRRAVPPLLKRQDSGIATADGPMQANMQCGMCGIAYFSATMKTKFCVTCRVLPEAQLPEGGAGWLPPPQQHPHAVTGSPQQQQHHQQRTPPPLLRQGSGMGQIGSEANMTCSVCNTEYFSATGKTTMCMTCRPAQHTQQHKQPDGAVGDRGSYPPPGLPPAHPSPLRVHQQQQQQQKQQQPDPMTYPPYNHGIGNIVKESVTSPLSLPKQNAPSTSPQGSPLHRLPAAQQPQEGANGHTLMCQGCNTMFFSASGLSTHCVSCRAGPRAQRGQAVPPWASPPNQVVAQQSAAVAAATGGSDLWSVPKQSASSSTTHNHAISALTNSPDHSQQHSDAQSHASHETGGSVFTSFTHDSELTNMTNPVLHGPAWQRAQYQGGDHRAYNHEP